MYGIYHKWADKEFFLCLSPKHQMYFQLKCTFEFFRDVLMRESESEIDQLHQDGMSTLGRYDLIVHKFTDDEISAILIARLKGFV